MKQRTWLLLSAAGLLSLAALAISQNGGLSQPPRQTEPATEPTVRKTEAEWRKILTPEQYHVTREKGTEQAFTGAYWHTKTDGLYRCVCCGQILFDSRTKFDSGTGWPSFFRPAGKGVILRSDDSLGMSRTEVACSRCGAHLGHVFDDGPQPTGQRYCMNSAALKLDPRPVAKSATPPTGK